MPGTIASIRPNCHSGMAEFVPHCALITSGEAAEYMAI
jgi:hypothetical protein